MSDAISMQPVDENDTSQWDIVKATQYGIFERVKQIVEKDGYEFFCEKSTIF